MKYVHIIDLNGLFVEDTFVDELTEFTIETQCPDGFYQPKWDGVQWVEGLTQAEIDTLKVVPVAEPTIEERTKANEDALLTLMGAVYGV